MTGATAPVFRSPYYPYARNKREEGVDLLSPFLESEIYGGKPKVMRDGDFRVLPTWALGTSYIRANKGLMNF